MFIPTFFFSQHKHKKHSIIKNQIEILWKSNDLMILIVLKTRPKENGNVNTCSNMIIYMIYATDL